MAHVYASSQAISNQIVSGLILESGDLGNIVVASRSVKDLDENKTRQFVDTFVWSQRSGLYEAISGIQSDTSKPLIHDQSLSQEIAITVRQQGAKWVLDIVNKYCMPKRVDLSPLIGDPLPSDHWFGGLSWSSDEKFIAFVAKSKSEKLNTVFGLDAKITDKAKCKYEFVDDWGEKFTELSNLEIVIVNTSDGTVRLLPFDARNCSCGQPVFLTSEDHYYSLIYTSWQINENNRKLGMVYCYHRPCSLFVADITEWLSDATHRPVHSCITCGLALARSPRVNSQGTELVFLGNKTGFESHNGCMALYIAHISCPTPATASSSSSQSSPLISLPSILINIVDLPESAESFPGIFADQLPRRCFLTSDSVIVNSVWRGSDSVLRVSIRSVDCIERVSTESVEWPAMSSPSTDGDKWNNPRLASYCALDCINNKLLLTMSSPNTPQQMLMIDYSDNEDTPKMSAFASQLSLATAVVLGGSCPEPDTRQAVSDIQWRIFDFIDEDSIPYNAILLTPGRKRHQDHDEAGQDESTGAVTDPSLPLIVVPHGGPHSCFTTAFSAAYAFLVTRLQSTVLLVNYRGSTGFGQRGITSLLGRIGRADVDDCMTCVRHVTNLYSSTASTANHFVIDSRKMSVVGGSHGGFLGAHLIGQFPSIFRSACLRNPVTNIASMTSTSDIPDWCWTEAGLSYDWATPANNQPTADHLAVMLRCSPLPLAQHVITPTLICLGAVDRRVPMSQGVEYYHALRAHHGDGIARMLVFPDDCHAIDRPTTEAEHWVAIAEWISLHSSH